MPRTLDPDVVRRVQRIALAKGGSLRPFADGSHSRTVEWDVSGKCQNPQFVALNSRAPAPTGAKTVIVTSKENRPNFVEMHVRCRTCPACLRYRAYQWTMRAKTEYRMAPRTWLSTLTLSPTSWTRLLSETRLHLSKGGTDFEALAGPEQFAELDRMLYGHVKRWLKRLRKNSEVPFRYLAITEAHKSGLPHMHVLIHEISKPLRYDANLKGSWEMGFDSYKLAGDAAGASYVCKYLSKDIRGRVRASLAYGDPPGSLMPPQAIAPATKEKGGVRNKQSPE